MGDDPLRIELTQPFVQSFVVGILEPKLLHVPLKIPVDFRNPEPPGPSGNGLGPKFIGGPFPVHEKPTPRSVKDFIENQHGHIASDSIAIRGDRIQNTHHGRTGFPMEIIQLSRISPG